MIRVFQQNRPGADIQVLGAGGEQEKPRHEGGAYQVGLERPINPNECTLSEVPRLRR